MEKKQIVINQTEQKVSKNGKNFWVIIDLQGNRYSTFDKKMFDDCTDAIGTIVNIEYETKDGFFNLKGAWATGEKPKETPVYKGEVPALDRQNSIIAQTLTKCVCEIKASNPEAEFKQTAISVWRTYRDFLRTLDNGGEEEEIPEEMD